MHFQTKNILKSNLYHTPKLSHEKKKTGWIKNRYLITFLKL
jgi:hypothetical protein